MLEGNPLTTSTTIFDQSLFLGHQHGGSNFDGDENNYAGILSPSR